MQFDRRSLLKVTGAAGAATLFPSATPAQKIGDGIDQFDLPKGYYTFEALPIGYTYATVRDRIPFDWAVVGGDDYRVYTEDGTRYLEFTGDLTAGEAVTYFLEAPEATGEHQFGPAAARPASGDRAFVRFTGSETNSVIGVDQTTLDA
jgi:hypothetical protein